MELTVDYQTLQKPENTIRKFKCFGITEILNITKEFNSLKPSYGYFIQHPVEEDHPLIFMNFGSPENLVIAGMASDRMMQWLLDLQNSDSFFEGNIGFKKLPSETVHSLLEKKYNFKGHFHSFVYHYD